MPLCPETILLEFNFMLSQTLCPNQLEAVSYKQTDVFQCTVLRPPMSS